MLREGGGKSSCPQAVADRHGRAFANMWAAREEEQSGGKLSKPEDREAMIRVSAEELRRLSRTYGKRTAVGTDGFHMWHFSWLA